MNQKLYIKIRRQAPIFTVTRLASSEIRDYYYKLQKIIKLTQSQNKLTVF